MEDSYLIYFNGLSLEDLEFISSVSVHSLEVIQEAVSEGYVAIALPLSKMFRDSAQLVRYLDDPTYKVIPVATLKMYILIGEYIPCLK